MSKSDFCSHDHVDRLVDGRHLPYPGQAMQSYSRGSWGFAMIFGRALQCVMQV